MCLELQLSLCHRSGANALILPLVFWARANPSWMKRRNVQTVKEAKSEGGDVCSCTGCLLNTKIFILSDNLGNKFLGSEDILDDCHKFKGLFYS